MTSLTSTSPTPTSKDEGFPTAAIIVLAVGGYIVLFGIILIIRKCILNKTDSCCPDWCSEQCQCQSCCQGDPTQPGCITRCATSCNCFKYPSKQQFMDSCCPTKQWCDDTFCCCMSQQPGGQCCKCDDCCTGLGCGDCFNCPECKDCCDDCKCECCAQPETIDCCCIEVKLSGSNQRAGTDPRMSGYGGPMPGYGGGYLNQSGYLQGGGPPVHQQPGSSNITQQPWGGSGMHPRYSMQTLGSNLPPMGRQPSFSASQMMQQGSYGGMRGTGGSMVNSSMNNMNTSRSNVFQASQYGNLNT